MRFDSIQNVQDWCDKHPEACQKDWRILWLVKAYNGNMDDGSKMLTIANAIVRASYVDFTYTTTIQKYFGLPSTTTNNVRSSLLVLLGDLVQGWNEEITPEMVLVSKAIAKLGVANEVGFDYASSLQSAAKWVVEILKIVAPLVPALLNTTPGVDVVLPLARMAVQVHVADGVMVRSPQARLKAVAHRLSSLYSSLDLVRKYCPYDADLDYDDAAHGILTLGRSEIKTSALKLAEFYDKACSFINWLMGRSLWGRLPHHVRPLRTDPDFQAMMEDLNRLLEELEIRTREAGAVVGPLAQRLTSDKIFQAPREVRLRVQHEAMSDAIKRMQNLLGFVKAKKGRVPRMNVMPLPDYTLENWAEKAADYIVANWDSLGVAFMALARLMGFNWQFALPDITREDVVEQKRVVIDNLNLLTAGLSRLELKAEADGADLEPHPSPYVWPFDGTNITDAALSLKEFEKFRDEEYFPFKNTVGNFKIAELRQQVQDILQLVGSDIEGRTFGTLTEAVRNLIANVAKAHTQVETNAYSINQCSEQLAQYGQRIHAAEGNMRNIYERLRALETAAGSGGINGADFVALQAIVDQLRIKVEPLVGLTARMEQWKNQFPTRDVVELLRGDVEMLKVQIGTTSELSGQMQMLDARVRDIERLNVKSWSTTLRELNQRLVVLEQLDFLSLIDRVSVLEGIPRMTKVQLDGVADVLRTYPKFKTLLAKCVQYINAWGGSKTFGEEFEALDESMLARAQWEPLGPVPEPSPGLFKRFFRWCASFIPKKVEPVVSCGVYEAWDRRDWPRLLELFGLGIFDIDEVALKLAPRRLEAYQCVGSTGDLSEDLKCWILQTLQPSPVSPVEELLDSLSFAAAQNDPDPGPEPDSPEQQNDLSTDLESDSPEHIGPSFFFSSERFLPPLFSDLSVQDATSASEVLPAPGDPGPESSTLPEHSTSSSPPVARAWVKIRQGRIPERRALAQGLGYSVSRNRLWITHAERRYLQRAGAWRLEWEPFVHPSTLFTGPWDVFRELEAEGQNVVDEQADIGPERAAVRDHIGEVLEFQDTRDQMLSSLHPSVCVLSSDRVAAVTSGTPGSVWLTVPMREIFRGNGPLAGLMKTFGVVPGGMRLDVRWNVSPTNGIGMAVVYYEGGLLNKSQVDIVTAVHHPHRIWNPACEDSISFGFQPMSCAVGFHPSFLSGGDGLLVLVQMTNWHAAPTTAPKLTWVLSYDPQCKQNEQLITPLALPRNMTYRHHVGNLEFKANDTSPLRRSEINLGSPAVGPKYGYGLWQSLISLYRYYRADILIELIRTSSPFTSVTFGVSLLPGTRAAVVTPGLLAGVAHMELTFGLKESRKVVRFPAHLVGYDLESDTMDLTNTLDKAVALTFVIWVLDNPSNAMNDSVYVTVNVCGVENLVVHTPFGGNLPDSTRATVEFNSREVRIPNPGDLVQGTVPDFSYQHGLGQSANVWNLGLSWKERRDTKIVQPDSKDNLRMFFDAYRLVVGTPMLHFVLSPVVRILNSCVWLKGTLLYRVVWAALPTVKRSDWSGNIRVSVHGTTTLSLRQFHAASSEMAGAIEFAVDVKGPMFGFACLAIPYANMKDANKVVIELARATQFHYVEIYVMFGENVQVAGCGAFPYIPRAGNHRNQAFSPTGWDVEPLLR
ncbi:TPA_asm: polyprotein [Yucca gloriosa secovirus]|uniref:RNA2 polyprotein n=1 Tax=Yucca gloriosa secovirus TaxID=2936693 RepID=A0A9N6YJI7_9SECO|nr:TPA_asm: polyprotein [Yucca gloriosa secovirus]